MNLKRFGQPLTSKISLQQGSYVWRLPHTGVIEACLYVYVTVTLIMGKRVYLGLSEGQAFRSSGLGPVFVVMYISGRKLGSISTTSFQADQKSQTD